MWKSAALGVVCVFALCGAAVAQTGSLSAADKAFLKAAADANMTEAHLGKMAEDQSSDNGVKNFGQTLVQDHTKAYEDLSELASKTGASIPKGIDVRRDRAIEALMKEKGAAFDRQFLRHEVQDHQKTITEFRREAERGQNADLKAYASKTVPTLEAHLHKAAELEKAGTHTTTASADRRKR